MVRLAEIMGEIKSLKTESQAYNDVEQRDRETKRYRHRRTETVPGPFLGHFVKDFTKKTSDRDKKKR